MNSLLIVHRCLRVWNIDCWGPRTLTISPRNKLHTPVLPQNVTDYDVFPDYRRRRSRMRIPMIRFYHFVSTRYPGESVIKTRTTESRVKGHNGWLRLDDDNSAGNARFIARRKLFFFDAESFGCYPFRFLQIWNIGNGLRCILRCSRNEQTVFWDHSFIIFVLEKNINEFSIHKKSQALLKIGQQF